MDGNMEGQVCQFPSSAHVNIFYQKIGLIDDPQKIIIKAEFEWKNTK